MATRRGHAGSGGSLRLGSRWDLGDLNGAEPVAPLDSCADGQVPMMLCSGPNGKPVMFSAPSSPTIRMSCSR